MARGELEGALRGRRINGTACTSQVEVLPVSRGADASTPLVCDHQGTLVLAAEPPEGF